MLDRVNKVLIGKNISRTASAVLYGGSQAAAEGEIFILDKNRNILASGATVSDTDTIYIAEVLGDTYSYVTETGTSVTGVKKLIVSDPIEGSNVSSYKGRAYSAIVEQVVTIDGSTFAPVVGTEYVLRIVYTDTYERPGQVTMTYRKIATTTSSDDLWTAFVALINKHTERRVTASGTTELVLTGRAMPYDRTDDVNAIDEYYQVNFKAFLYSNNFGDTTVTYTTRPFTGEGTWQRVRDAEKFALSYRGIMNRTIFPVQMPAMRTVKSTTYQAIIIESDKKYTSPDSYDKKTRLTTEVYIPVGAGQLTDVLNVLNPWMASTPKAFNNVSF
jgi:hypothetical protein